MENKGVGSTSSNGDKELDQGSLLIVDDSELNRNMLSRRLERRGYTVTLAKNGKEALELLKAQEFDLVLLDIMMPDIDGLTVLDIVRKMYSVAELPVILVTARAHSDDVVLGLERGANDYVTKPIDFAVTLARVRTQLKIKAAEKALRESEERYLLAARGANDGLWDWDLKNNKLFLSPRWQAMFGLKEEERFGLPNIWFDRVHPEDLAKLKNAIRNYLNGEGDFFECHHRVLHEQGYYLWVYSRGIALRNENEQATRIAGSMTDVTNQNSLEPLTNLTSQHSFTTQLQALIHKKKYFSDICSAIILFNIDQFSTINQRYGRKIGDQLLREIARRLRICLRSDDLASRYEADTFVVVLEKLSDKSEVIPVIHRIQNEFTLPFHLANEKTQISIRIGVLLFRHYEGEAIELITETQKLAREAQQTPDKLLIREWPTLGRPSSPTHFSDLPPINSIREEEKID